MKRRRSASGAALLAYHWLRAEEWEKALTYTLEAAERARKLFARPEAINHYWQALELIERLPQTLRTQSRPVRRHCVARSASGLEADEGAEAHMLRHLDQATDECH